jgi:hypothetical protein
MMKLIVFGKAYKIEKSELKHLRSRDKYALIVVIYFMGDLNVGPYLQAPRVPHHHRLPPPLCLILLHR